MKKLQLNGVTPNILQFMECHAMTKGTVKWFNEKKGYGFLSQDDGTDVFVHHTGIQGDGFKTLFEGDRVEFTIEQSDKGPRAVSVKTIG